MRGRELAAYLTCCVAWGSTWVVIKTGLQDLPPLRFAGLRMLLACLLLIPLALRSAWKDLRPGDWPHVAVVGALNIFLSYALMFTAQRSIPSGLAAVLFATFPIWVGFNAHWLLPAERLTAARILAGVLGVGGIAMLQLPSLAGLSLGSSAWLPLLLALCAPIVAAFSNVWMKRRLSHVPSAINLWAQTLVGGALLLGTSLAVEQDAVIHWTPRALFAIAYLAIIGTVLTFLLLFWLLPRIPISAVGVIPLLDTLIALTLGTLIAGEAVSWTLAVGAALILSGAVLANRAVPSAAPPEQQAATLP